MSLNQGTVYLVDDDASVRRSLGRILSLRDWSVIPLSSSLEFLAFEPKAVPSCLLLDFQMPDMNGLELQQKMLEQGIHIPIVFLSGQSDIPVSVAAMKLGAVDFLVKPAEAEQIFEAIEVAFKRHVEQLTSSRECDEILKRLQSLSPRETEVLKEVVKGRLNKQIGFDFGIAEKTVKVHRARVMEKMEARSLAQLVRMCYDVGILDGSEGG